MDAVTLEQPAARSVEAKAIAPAAFAHFVLRTSNMAAMRSWYATVLTAHIVQENEQICFLTYDEEHHRLALVNVAGLHAPDAETWGLAHVAYSYGSLGDLLSTYVRLRDAGIRPVRTINHGPSFSFYYRDPDGNAVELQVDAFPTKAEASAFFTSPAFKENPIGVLFDVEAVIRAYEAGTPVADLLRRPDGPAERPMGSR